MLVTTYPGPRGATATKQRPLIRHLNNIPNTFAAANSTLQPRPLHSVSYAMYMHTVPQGSKKIHRQHVMDFSRNTAPICMSQLVARLRMMYVCMYVGSGESVSCREDVWTWWRAGFRHCGRRYLISAGSISSSLRRCCSERYLDRKGAVGAAWRAEGRRGKG